MGSSGGGGLGLGNSRGTSGTGYSYPSVVGLGVGGGWTSGFCSVSASTGSTGGGGSYGGGVGLGPSTQVSAQPSKQQRPLLGQSVSLCPGLQQLDTATAHSSSDPAEAAGHSPTSPSPPAPPNAPSAAAYRLVDPSQSTLNHQSQTKILWLNKVPLGHRKDTGKSSLGPLRQT